MRFEFATATRIIFGQGTVQEVAPLATEMGSHAFVVTGHTVKRAEPLFEQLRKHQIKYVTFNVPSEPTTAIAKVAISQARQAKSDLVLKQASFFSLQYNEIDDFAWTQLSCSSRLAG